MTNSHKNLLILLDDRCSTCETLGKIVGSRRYGDIYYKRKKLSDYLITYLPGWSRQNFIHIKDDKDIQSLYNKIKYDLDKISILIISGKAAFPDPQNITQLIEKLPYAQESFTDSLLKPLLVYMKTSYDLLELWEDFAIQPITEWETPWQNYQRLKSFTPIRLDNIKNFLSFFSDSTSTRHFNNVSIDTYYYTKSSSDKKKMMAEYKFFNLVPEQMKPWFIEPFDYQEKTDRASYKMMRYYFSDAALQWIHGAFNENGFSAFIDKLLYFITQRTKKKFSSEITANITKNLFINKVEDRINQFMALAEGKKIDLLAKSISPEIDLLHLLNRYKRLFKEYQKQIDTDELVIGHGDPCFSNILYDQNHYFMKLIDPKGATTEEELWTHPLYDLCKISHSVIGDYDFINNGLYNICFTDDNNATLLPIYGEHSALKSIFIKKIEQQGFNLKIVRLCEASLFLSMLPLHIDYPNKILAFILTAKNILDEIEGLNDESNG